MRPKIKILIIVTRAELGGAQNHISSLVNGLHKNIQFVLCVGTKGVLIDTFSSLKLRVHVIPSLNKKHFLRSAIAISRIIIQEQPNIVHTHSAVASFVGRITAKLLQKKTLYTVHGWHFVPNSVMKRRLLGPLLEFIARPFTDHWITVSAYDKKLGLKKHAIVDSRCSIIENGVTDKLIPLQNNRPKNVFNIALIGRATYQKNCLAAIAIIKQCNPRVKLSIFSASGDHLPSLISSITEQNLTDRITVIDDNNDAGEQLNNFDLLLITSRYEGMPLCALEAMRAGLPIVASNVCGMNEIVHHEKNGYLFDLNDTTTAVHYLQILQNNQKLCKTMGSVSRKLFIDQYQEQIMIDKTAEIYKSLLANNVARPTKLNDQNNKLQKDNDGDHKH